MPNGTELDREITEIYRGHADGLLRYAAGLSSRNEASRDAVQEAFLRYFIERRYGRAIGNSRAWLHQVVRNYLLDRLKSAAAQCEVAIVDLERLPARQRNPEDLVRQAETAHKFASVLTRRELECVELRGEGLSYEEIARAMAVTPGTVGATLTHAHEKLRELKDRRQSGSGTSPERSRNRRPVVKTRRRSRPPATVTQ